MLSIGDLQSLQKKQIELDNYIYKKWNLNSLQTYQKRKVAFLVELGEFINEQRDFKFWSHKKSSPEQILLEEYIDCLHFMLSLSNDVKFDFSQIDWKAIPICHDLSNLYLQVYKLFASFSVSDATDDFKIFVLSFLAIAQSLNWTETMIIDAYKKKNAVNFKRQDANY